MSVNFGSSEAVFINVYKDLLFVLGVHADGDRSVVEKVHLHHGTELARADRFAHSLGHQFYKAVVERNRDIVWCGVDPTGAVALLVAGHQGELGDDEYVAANIFDAEVLKKAQANPEQYKNLQVRVCGWNAYFVNLSKAEQDGFIRQAENYA